MPRYKTDVQKSIVFLYICSELSENEVKKTIPFIITSERTKLGVNLTKEVKHLYNNNWNKDLDKWKVSHVHGLEELMLLRWQYSPNWSTNSI